jgi:hypothetical protein
MADLDDVRRWQATPMEADTETNAYRATTQCDAMK